MGYLSAAALDSAMYPLQTKALRPGESAVAAARREPDAQVSGRRYGDRFDLAAPLCRRTPKQSEIRFGRQTQPGWWSLEVLGLPPGRAG